MKIDIKTIENYDGMTPEEKLSALENYEFADNSEEVERLNGELNRYKNAVTKANAEAKKYKDEKMAAMSAEDKKKAETEELIASLKEQNASLLKAQEISGYENQYISLGYSAELAKDTAIAQANGDYNKMMSNHKQFLTDEKKRIESAALNRQPELTSGKAFDKQTAEEAQMNQLRRYAGLIR